MGEHEIEVKELEQQLQGKDREIGELQRSNEELQALKQVISENIATIRQIQEENLNLKRKIEELENGIIPHLENDIKQLQNKNQSLNMQLENTRQQLQGEQQARANEV